MLKNLFLLSFLVNSPFFSIVNAQTNSSILQDLNQDEIIEIVAFGDSITRGVGDFFGVGASTPDILPTPAGEAGYPLRLETILGVSVSNKGIRGESLSDSGIYRFAKTVSATAADYVIISEGANDTFLSVSAQTLRRNMQAMVNMTRAMGKEPIISTIPEPCCNHYGSRPFINAFNQEYRDVADLNEVPLADTEKAFAQTCSGDECFLFNIPDGLHPNTTGYDAMAQTIIATLFGIDLIGPGGNILLAQALGVDPSTIVVTSQPPISTPVNP